MWQRFPAALERRLGRRAGLVAVALAVVAGLSAATLLSFRYATWHTHVFDLGSYDQKVWVASVQHDLAAVVEQTYRGGERVAPCGTARYWGVCHFQPLYALYAVLYRVWPSPLLLLWSQALLVASGVVPCYRLLSDRLASSGAGVLASGLYLLHPAVQFNALLDFRPDHLAIPFFLWAYWLVDRGRWGWAIVAAAVPALAKESLLLAFAAFGLYLALRARRVAAGLAVATAGMVVFAIVTFGLLAGPGYSEGAFMIGRYFSGGADVLAPELLARKVLYLVALFGPLAFLPLRDPLTLLPALPSIGISLLSNDVPHVSIQSQYSAAVIAPAFAGLASVLARRPPAPGGRSAPVHALGALVVLGVFFALAQGPTPLSINFWSAPWGLQWHYHQYLPDRQAALNEAARMIPADPDVMVVSQNDVNSAALAHRHYFVAFPNGLERADYVLLDTGRQPFLYWIVSRDRRPYDDLVGRLRAAPEYRVAFERDGVLLFARVGPRRPGPPDPGALPVRPKGLPK